MDHASPTTLHLGSNALTVPLRGPTLASKLIAGLDRYFTMAIGSRFEERDAWRDEILERWERFFSASEPGNNVVRGGVRVRRYHEQTDRTLIRIVSPDFIFTRRLKKRQFIR